MDGLAYLDSLCLYRVKPGLSRILKILDAFGNPQHRVPSLIVGGTNGKGSVSATISSVLESQGYKTALYTSPHLLSVTERIKINGREIPVDTLSNLLLEIKEVALKLHEEPSFFEVLTAAAFLYFACEKADISVLEVGMGGRWDATNVVTPLVSVITNVSMDHMEFLGNTIEEIASEKAGIIKPSVPVVTGARDKALRKIELVARDNLSPTVVLYRDFTYEGKTPRDFTYLGPMWHLKGLSLNLQGLFQLENASVAISALECLSRFHGIKIEENNLRTALSTTRWEGRMEILRESPPLILDGAHNKAGAAALRDSLKHMFPGKRFVFLIGMLSDKDHSGYIEELVEITDIVAVTNIPSKRGTDAKTLASKFKNLTNRVEVIEDTEEALCRVANLEAPVCITGSLYLVAEAKKLLSKEVLL
ncbi:MAG: bifunctional folylpolyglutamate synthase/dihydrofolate synthase [Deltaproteobacteria bacterium]|nr:MAG: bifunctional folylpolyglutamate synthase/dihydrofolate synthase [Deltaproteobacteria bacterium]